MKFSITFDTPLSIQGKQITFGEHHVDDIPDDVRHVLEKFATDDGITVEFDTKKMSAYVVPIKKIKNRK